MSQISEQNKQRYKDIFETFDDNQDGALCLTELEPVLQCCGYNPTDEDKQKFMSEFDKDSSGTIDFDEFMSFMEKVQGEQGCPEDQMEMIREELKKYDTDGSGFLERNEIKRLLTDDATDEDIDDLLDQADTNKDGKIDCEELAKLMTSLY